MDKNPKNNEELRELEEAASKLYFRMNHSLNAGEYEDYKKWSAEFLQIRKEIKSRKSRVLKTVLKCVEVATPIMGLVGTTVSAVCKLQEAKIVAEAYERGYKIVTDYEKDGEIPWKEATRIVHKIR